MSAHLIHVAAVVPVPVGHRVEVRIYAVEEGLFSTAWKVKDHDPHIVDLTTGIVYAPGWLFEAIALLTIGEVRPSLPLEVRSDLREHSRITGVVRACRVAWLGSGSNTFPQTTLSVEAD
jgi:hypothetical protein